MFVREIDDGFIVPDAIVRRARTHTRIRTTFARDFLSLSRAHARTHSHRGKQVWSAAEVVVKVCCPLKRGGLMALIKERERKCKSLLEPGFAVSSLFVFPFHLVN